MEPGDSCRNCRWWQETGPFLGFCRTQPPTRDGYGMAVWPLSRADDWCAYFGPRLEPEAQEETN